MTPVEAAQLLVLAELFALAHGQVPSEAARPIAERVWREPDGEPTVTRGERFGKVVFWSSRGGQRRTRLKMLAGHLLRIGVDPLLTLGLLQAHNLVRNSPPLPPEEVEEAVRWVASQEAERLEAAT